MTEKILMARSVTELRVRVSCWKQEGLRVALVPTMGALHDGHLALVTKARLHADKVVGSVFVNPKQFGPGEDFEAYPRNPDHDARMLAAAGCDLVYLPGPDEMYPEGFALEVCVTGLTEVLCGRSRPVFFAGITTVVTKLFNQCRPDIAVFGEKDYQQLLVIRKLVRDLDLPVEILGQPIVREADGLAMSSRNVYLSADEREVAPKLNETMQTMAAALTAGDSAEDVLGEAAHRLGMLGFKLDYLEIRDAATLSSNVTTGPLQDPQDYRIFAAVLLGRTRLIDNIPAQSGA